ncbi:hypothetical protein D2U88_10755 [Flagellimonas aequoris]|uniref:Uncharacterized protein n=1 Tax=Flagellimonas aequoris TaxID=2306997 RepID=A0A418N7E3_9FLAO|nr:hypothetical protein D2U88_10755 [Allomuricauda aequoris]
MKKYVVIHICFVLQNFHYVFAQIQSRRVWYDVSMEDFYEGAMDAGLSESQAMDVVDKVYKACAGIV